MTGKAFRGRKLTGGTSQGEVLVSRRAFTFAHGVNPATGQVTDVHSDILGSNVKGKVLVYPHGKGSTTASAWFLETVREGNAPSAIVTESTDLSAVIGSVMSGRVYGKSIPVVSSLPGEFYRIAQNGMHVVVDGKKGEVTLEK